MKDQGQVMVFDLNGYSTAKQVCCAALEIQIENQLKAVTTGIKNLINDIPTATCIIYTKKLLKQTIQALTILQFTVKIIRDENYEICWGDFYKEVMDENWAYQVTSLVKREVD